MIGKFKRIARETAEQSGLDADIIYYFLCDVARVKKTRNFPVKAYPGQVYVDEGNKIGERLYKFSGAAWCDRGGYDYEGAILRRQEARDE